MVHPISVGKNQRMSYSNIDEVMDMPNLIEVQKNSYNWFLEEGLKEVFNDVSPISDYTGNLVLEFVDYSLDGKPKYSVEECKERDVTYSAPLKVKIRLANKSTNEVKEQEVFMGDFPLMTDQGTFIINGAERVIVSQLVRSPGVYYDEQIDKSGKRLHSATVIPNRGAWLEYETDSNDVLWVRIDRTRKIPITVLLKALGYGTDQQIENVLGEDERIKVTLQKDTTKNTEEGLIEVYKRLRPGEPPTVESAKSLIESLFFDPKRYDLAKVGRYKFNKKLSLASRLSGQKLEKDIVDPKTGEILAAAGDKITRDKAQQIQNAGINEAFILSEGRAVKILGNNVVDINKYLPFDVSDLSIRELVNLGILKEILNKYESEADIKEEIKKRIHDLIPKHIVIDDIMASVSYNLNLIYNVGNVDDIDHLGNRRLRSVGELLQNQFRIGLSRMERVVKERMTIQDIDVVTPQQLINIRPVAASIKEFFGSSQLSQFMDQTNPLAELTHKRRLSALGPGGLSRERAGFEVRDVHHSHYSRMCPIETPEGPNIGLIGSLSTYARINEYGFIEAPYRVVKIDESGEKIVTDEIVYVTADEEDDYIVAQANEALDAEGRFIDKKVTARIRHEIVVVPISEVEYMDVSPKQVVSVATAMIPFLENDDANRALMGSNMQRQAVPLIKPESPIVGTGMEYKAAIDSGVVILARNGGVVEKVSSNEIVIRNDDGGRDRYKLLKFLRSNQGTCINQRPFVKKGEIVKKGQVIGDGPSTDYGEIGLGRNVLIGFMTWEGYNYEDAILISEKLVKEDVFTSIHIEEYEAEARDTKLGPEEITRDIPNVGEEALKDLDERGIIRIGAEVRTGDILVGKVTPKGETELTAEERLLRAIFGEKAREVRDTSLRVPHGEAGIIVDVKVFTRENGDELPPGVNQLVRVYIAQKRKISVGDKMAGRHGNKGVISRILPEEDMPFLPNGTPLEIVLNPLGVPSRMNIGQVLEVHLGLAAKALGWKIATPVFDGANENDIMDTLETANKFIQVKKQLKAIKNKISYTEDEEPGDFNIDENVEIINEYLADPVFELDKKLNHFKEKIKDTDLNNIKDMENLLGGLEDNPLVDVNLDRTGKITLRDGRTGEYFDNDVTVGYMYILKLLHLVDDKIHARSTGPYSLVTQQPLGGKAQFGGQRFGEMEVWALEAYGAAHTLQEILTVKSDDVVGRVKTYESIVKGENIPEPGVPESFKVLIKELQSLALDVKVLSEENEEITIKESVDDDLEDLSNEMETREDVDLSNLPYKGGVEEEKDNLYDDYDEDAEEEDFEIDLDIDDLIKNETQEEEEEEEDY
ncbi:DNA-directed RNA polymerase subunit beta [Lutispora saccharofermentans]|uniref:DNA-directed RNA polymerase subunit beta n=1 Tax=Lutispora saccharofermentans TaxID=3024236 RepID=A0ABT1NI60_9FIRM|nr:DNA-directed RNA polymerase subunit beta [Lutispora saccharofermentans]MCQ1530950.1 DNA-directed RNA polymerase subunit beta [Lutispora saccharofermentans]